MVDLSQFTNEMVFEREDVKEFLKSHDLDPESLNPYSLSRLAEYAHQKESTAKTGYEPVLVLENGLIDVIYRETPELIERRKRKSAELNFERASIISDQTIKAASFNNFVAKTEDEQKALDFMQKVAKFYEQGGDGNTVISGQFGSGKSHLAMSVLKDCLENSNLTVIFASWSEVLAKIKDSFNNRDQIYTEDYFRAVLKNVDLLVLDDVGSEKVTDYSISLLTDVLDGRTKTIITTNLTSKELQATYQGRIYSRMFRNVGKKAFNFSGISDKRISKLPF